MRTTILSTLGAITLTVLMLAAPLRPAAAADAKSADAKAAVGTVVVKQGQVEIMKGGQSEWDKVAKGMLIFEGDRIRTRELSTAAILLQDGSMTKLAANTDLMIPVKTGDKKNRVKLLLGRLWAKISKQNSDLEIETPSAVAAIKGTQLDLAVTETGEVELTVWDGMIRFFNSQGEVLVRASQRSRVQGGKAPSQPVAVNLGTLDQWFESVVEVPAAKSVKVTVRDAGGQEQKINLKYQRK